MIVSVRRRKNEQTNNSRDRRDTQCRRYWTRFVHCRDEHRPGHKAVERKHHSWIFMANRPIPPEIRPFLGSIDHWFPLISGLFEPLFSGRVGRLYRGGRLTSHEFTHWKVPALIFWKKIRLQLLWDLPVTCINTCQKQQSKTVKNKNQRMHHY